MKNTGKHAQQTVRRSTVQNLSVDMNTILEDTKESKNVTIFVGKGTLKPNKPFAILFYESMLNVFISHSLSKTDMRVLLSILSFVSTGNAISLTQKLIANAAKLTRAQVCLSYKKLISSGLIIEDLGTGSLFLNPQIIAKESLKNSTKSLAYSLEKSATNLQNY